jgi:LPXTG-motif cell wall-anchored protein
MDNSRGAVQLKSNSKQFQFSKKTLIGLFVASLTLGSFVTPANAAPSTREVCASNVSVGDLIFPPSNRFEAADSGMRAPLNAGENYRLPDGLGDTVPAGLACTSSWSVQQPVIKDGFFEFASLVNRGDSYLDSDGFLHVNFVDVSPGAFGIAVKVINAATAEGFKATNNVDLLRNGQPNSPSGNQPGSGTYSASWTYGPFNQATRAQFDSGALIVGLFAMGMQNNGSATDSLASMKVEVWTSSVVSFNANGGTGTMSDQLGSSAKALASNSFTRTGFNFDGWAENADGTGTRYADGATFDFSSDKNLFAQWTPVPAAPASTTPTVTLAATGANVEWLMVAGFIALIAGASFLTVSRRKRTA